VSRIPKVLHYVFGMARDFGGKPWSLVHHVCVKSAVERIAPKRTYLYYEFEPTGPWWELSRELVTPVEIEAPRKIFGRPLESMAHRADVARLQKLLEHGGIYLDADVLVQRSFDDLLDHSTVLGQEGVDAEWGLTNAVILAEPQAPFLRRWLEEYRSFRGTGQLDCSWNEHSVQLPWKLAQKHPNEVTILPHTAFFWPLWVEDHLRWIFESDEPIPAYGAYANHLWEARGWRYMEDLTLRRVRKVNTNFHIWARPLLKNLPNSYGAPSLGERLRKAKSRKLREGRKFFWEGHRRFARALDRGRRIIAHRRGLWR